MGRLAIAGLLCAAATTFIIAASLERATPGAAWKWLSIAALAAVCMGGVAAILIF